MLVARKLSRTTYIVCETWNHGDPDLISANREMRIRGDKEVVEQAHVGHSLTSLGIAIADACLNITHERARRRT